MQKFYQNRWFKIGLPILVLVAVIAGALWYSTEGDFFQGYLKRSAPVPTPSEPISRLPDPTMAECESYKEYFAGCHLTSSLDGDISHAVRCEELFSEYWHDWPTEEECAQLDPATADPADVTYCEELCIGTAGEAEKDAEYVAEAEEEAEAAEATLEIVEAEDTEPVADSVFSDVVLADNPHIQYVYEEGLFSGYPDGTFRPEGIINRAEFMKVIFFWLDLPEATTPATFDDVPADSWFAPYVSAAVEAGIVTGYDSGLFGPGDDMTQAALVKIIVNGSVFSDMLDADYGTAWYDSYYKVAIDNGLLDEADKAPSELATRGLAAELIWKADQAV